MVKNNQGPNWQPSIAKHNGTCNMCKKRYLKGSRVKWAKGDGTRGITIHEVCPDITNDLNKKDSN